MLLIGNDGFEKLSYRGDVPMPVAATGDVLIRIGAAGVNNTDINTRTAWHSKSVTAPTVDGGASGFVEAQTDDSGWTGAVPHFPRIQGADACGRIVDVGASVSSNRIGERVIVEPIFCDPAGHAFDAIYFGSEVDGKFAEFSSVPSRRAHAINSPLSYDELASFLSVYGAAEKMLTCAAFSAGEQVLIPGASGGFGTAAVQLAKRRGAMVTAIASAAKHDAVVALSADHVIACDTDLAACVGPDRFHAIIESVGGEQLGTRLYALKRGGRYAVDAAGSIGTLDLRTLYLNDMRLVGSTTLNRGVFTNLFSYIDACVMKALVSPTYR